MYISGHRLAEKANGTVATAAKRNYNSHGPRDTEYDLLDIGISQ